MYGLGFLFADTRPSYTVPGASLAYVQATTDQMQRDFNRRIDSLELACAGLWQLLKEKNGYTDQEIVEAIRKIDLMDGKADGRVRMSDETCPKCGHKLLSQRSPKCSWCGADVGKPPF